MSRKETVREPGSERLNRRLLLQVGAGVLVLGALPAEAAPPVAALPPRNSVPLSLDLKRRTGIASVTLDAEGNGAFLDAAQKPHGSFTSSITGNRASLIITPLGGQRLDCELTVTKSGANVTLDGTINGGRLHALASSASGGIVGAAVVPKVDSASLGAVQAVNQALATQLQAHGSNCKQLIIMCACYLMLGDNHSAGGYLLRYAMECM
jgi:hypothetical protein